MPILKPVNMNRPRMPPPPGPPGNGENFERKIENLKLKCGNFADKLISNGQSSESLNSLNDHGQNVTRVLAGTPIRKVNKIF